MIQNFHLPLSIQAHTQLQELKAAIARLQIQEGKDIWHYTWGNSNFTAAKAYRVMIGHRPVHPIFQWIWSSRCQMKHKVFFWLLLQDRLSTRVLLRRRTMELDNYSCDHCILQKLETVTHLFLRCNFAKAYWASIGAAVRTSRPLLGIFRLLKEKLQVPFFMEVIILMVWSIWTTRNDWIFNNIDPTVQNCKRKFILEMSLLTHSTKPEISVAIDSWL